MLKNVVKWLHVHKRERQTYKPNTTMKPLYTVISEYSLEAGKVGQPIGEPVLTPHADGKSALEHLWVMMETPRNRNGARFMVRFTDGVEVPFDAAYERVFGVPPVYRDNKRTLYPRMSVTFKA